MTRTWTHAAQGVALLVATLTAVPPALAYEVRCESKDHRYRYCRADVGSGRVTVDRELSDSGCQYGRSWGYDERGVWVDRGCRAEFHVEERHWSHHDHWDDDDRDERHHDSHGSDKGAAVAGAVAGAVLLGAIIAGASQSGSASHDQAPAWLIGTFRGYDSRVDGDVDLTVSPSGSVDARRNGASVSGYYTRDQRIVLGGTTFDVQREGSGFRTSQVGDGGNQVHYTRIR